MQTALKPVIFTCLLLGMGWSSVLFLPEASSPGDAETPRLVPAVWSPAVTPPRVRQVALPGPNNEAFRTFPIGDPTRVVLRADRSALDRLTPRERQDQALDWVLFSVVSDAGLTADEINRILFDVPTSRHGHLRRLGSAEHGRTRSCHIGDGTIVALIPKSEGIDREELVAHVADEWRKNLGQKPAKLLVFDYEVTADAKQAAVTRTEEIAGATLFSEYRYHEATIPDAESLKQFLSRVTNVTVASVQDGALRLGGRTFPRYRGIGYEEVKTICRGYSEIAKQASAEDDDIDLERFGDRDLRDLTAEELADYFRLVLQRDRKRQRVAAPDGIGFSLDPKDDYKALLAWFDAKGAKELARIGTAVGFNTSDTVLDQIRREIEAEDVTPMLRLIELFKLSRQRRKVIGADGIDEAEIRKVSEDVRGFGFQAARYEGGLRGTDVGMVFFYCDLLAKLWMGLDRETIDLRQAVPGFPTYPDGGTARIFFQEMINNPDTRIWFGVNKDALHLTQQRQAVVFAPCAARIFAAANNPLAPGKEVPVGERDDRTIGWWNRHFEEIARYEQEYERLNQYMKWTVIASWLHAIKQANCLEIFDAVPVPNNHWFPDWVKARPDLRFSRWDLCEFFPKEDKRSDTEAMPLLYSASFANFGFSDKIMQMAGGVSGYGIRDLRDRGSLPAEVAREVSLTMRGIDPKTVVAAKANEISEIRMLNGNTYRFQANDNVSGRMEIQIRPEVIEGRVPLRGAMANSNKPLQGPYGEILRQDFVRQVDLSDTLATFTTTCKIGTVSKLEVERTPGAVVVSFESGAVESGLALIRDLSSTDLDVGEFLAADPRVASFREGGLSDWRIRLSGQDSGLLIVEDLMPQSGIPGDWHARVADTQVGSRCYWVAWIDSNVVARVLRADNEAFGEKPQQDLAGRKVAIDRFLSQGWYAETIAQCRDARMVHGATPLLELRQRIAEILYLEADYSAATSESANRLAEEATRVFERIKEIENSNRGEQVARELVMGLDETPEIVDLFRRSGYRLESTDDGQLRILSEAGEAVAIADFVAQHSGKLVSVSLDLGQLSESQQSELLAQIRTANQALLDRGVEVPRLVFETGIDFQGESSADRTLRLLDWNSAKFSGDEASLKGVPGAGPVALEILKQLDDAGGLVVEAGGRTIRFRVAHSDAQDAMLDSLIRNAVEGNLTEHEVLVFCALNPAKILAFRNAVLANGGRSVVLPFNEQVDIPAAVLAILALRKSLPITNASTSQDVLRAGYREARRLVAQCKNEISEVEAVKRLEFLLREFGNDTIQEFFKEGGASDQNLDSLLESLQNDILLFNLFTIRARLEPGQGGISSKFCGGWAALAA
jgi:hypothetical protein